MKLRYCSLLLLVAAQTSSSLAQDPYYHRERGMVLGGLLGAVTGGVIGDKNDETAAGAAIGAAVGALTGAAMGDSVDNDIAWRQAAQQRQAASQLSRAVSMHDVIAMSQAGLSDSVIVNHIRTNGVVSRPQPAELITMAQAGVREGVITAMQTAPLAGAATPVVPYSSPVIVERHHYVAPTPYPYPYPYAWPHRYPVHSHRPRSGVSWEFSFGR